MSSYDELAIYVCPACRGVLEEAGSVLRCTMCGRAYSVAGGVPDFVAEPLAGSADPVLRRMRFIDRLASIYETPLWYPVVLAIFGGWSAPSFQALVSAVAHDVRSVRGRVLDVACGPGTFGRRVASERNAVWGIDISPGMLRQAMAYVARDGVANVHFARARVETLPFAAATFDAIICCGSLHLFGDTLAALREIARVMKPGAILSVFTFAAGTGGVLRFPAVRDWLHRRHGLHAFDRGAIARDVAAAGLTEFQPELAGSILTFSARKPAA